MRRTQWYRIIIFATLGVVLLFFTLVAGVIIGGHSERVQEWVQGVLPPEATQDFEIRFERYTDAQRQVILDHVAAALRNLPGGASEFEKVAAINDYLYQYFHRQNSNGAGGADYLTNGESICGGTVVSMAEMLYSQKIKSKYAYVYGGLVAHSMLEVFFSDGTRGLFDPYNGYLFYNKELARPISITDILTGINLNEVTFYSSQPKQEITGEIVPLSDVFLSYLDHDTLDRDFDPVELFARMDGAGVANEGYKDYLEVALNPGEHIGEPAWTPESEAPNPWNTLAVWRKNNGDYLSWAYLLGQTAHGYDVKHIYHLEGLTPGQRYTLRHYLVRGYLSVNDTNDGPVITIQPISPFQPGQFSGLEAFNIPLDDRFTPRVHDFTFEAQAAQADFIYDVSGIIIVAAIELISEPISTATINDDVTLSCLTDEMVENIRRGVEQIDAAFGTCQAELQAVLTRAAPVFETMEEVDLSAVFACLVAYRLAPYGGSSALTIEDILQASQLDCDNYAAATVNLFNVLNEYDEASSLYIVGWHGGAVGNHAQIFYFNPETDTRLLLDPTVALVAWTDFDGVAAGVPVPPSYIVSFRTRNELEDFNTRVLDALVQGAYFPSDILYFYEDLEQMLGSNEGNARFITPGGIQLRIEQDE
jgi:hypothetical protein